ncbi:MAG: hypothetical protein ACNA7W_12605 [Pseudomonadales bacterium]
MKYRNYLRSAGLALAMMGAGYAYALNDDAEPAALEQEAERLDPVEIAARNALFEALDRAGDGYISRAEAMAHEDLAQQFEQLDADGDGRISRAEFAEFDVDLGTTEEPRAEPSRAGGMPSDQRAWEAATRKQREHGAAPTQQARSQDQVALEDRPGERPVEAGPENVLIMRAQVANIAYETIDALQVHTLLSPEDAVGWSVFSADPPASYLSPGVGMARHERGEVYFLTMSGVPPTDDTVRYVLTFDDEDLFREFRQGQLDGPTLERARADGFMEAHQVTLAERMEVEPIGLAGYRFELDGQLERALVGVPSRTQPLIDEEEPRVHDN